MSLDPFDFVIRLVALFVGVYIVVLMGRAIAARIAGNHAPLVLGTALINISLPLPRRYSDEDDENDMETGNTETLKTSGNSGETAGETPEMVTMNYSGEQHLVPRLSREEYHELISVRVRAIDLLDRCVKYYRDNQAADSGVIPRYNKIGMKATDRQAAVDNLWYSQYVVKAPNETKVDPAYFATCKELMQAIIDKRARVFPLGYLEQQEKKRMDIVANLPESKRDDD